jgi:hypothetical protein
VLVAHDAPPVIWRGMLHVVLRRSSLAGIWAGEYHQDAFDQAGRRLARV